MALSAGEQYSRGGVIDAYGRTVVKSEAANSALSAGEQYSGGFLRDADGRQVICQDTLNAALGAGEQRSGGFVLDSVGRIAVAVDTVNAPLSGQEQYSGGTLRDAQGRLVVVLDTLGSAPSGGESFSGGNLTDSQGRIVIAIEGGGGGSTYDAAVVADSPGAYIKLAETSGSAAADSSGNGHGGLYSGTVTLNQAGPTTDGAPAVLFDGVSGICTLDTLGNAGSTLINSTWEIFCKTTTAGTVKSIFGTVDTGSSNILEVDLNTSAGGATAGSTDLQLRTPAAGNLFCNITNAIYDGAWHHLAFVVSGTTSATITPYVDGVAGTPSSPTAAVFNLNFGFPMMIGARSLRGVASQFANATLARFAWYPSSLSGTRIAAHFAAR